MQKSVNKVSDVLEIKEVASGLLLKCASDQNLDNVKVQAFFVDENFTKREFIPLLKLTDLLKILGVAIPNLSKVIDGKKQVLVPFSKGGSLSLSDDSFIEFHLTNTDGTSKAIDVQTYENVGKSEPLVIQLLKLDSNVSTKDIDVNFYDFFLSFTTPNELQVMRDGGRVRFEKDILNFDRNTRDTGYSDICSLSLIGVSTISVYKDSGSDYTLYLLDIL